jgi:signal transduction histidine kinase
MCDRLDAARERADDEAEKRIRAVEQLRHADRLRTVGTLASGIAHELGTPLNVIAMRAKMIATKEVPLEEAPDNAKVIVGQTERVTKIVRQLLDFARRRAPQRAEIDVRELAEHTGHLLAPLAKKTNVAIDLAPGEPVHAKVDSAQIEQAITNIVMNGVQAMPEGGKLTIAVSTTEAAPPETPDMPKKCALIEISDTGIGMSEENLARISEPFFTTKEVGLGTGLGLSVTHGFLQDHGGWMTAESTLGRGTTFKVYLPV